MKIKNKNLEWNVFVYDFNSQKIIIKNIFTNSFYDKLKKENINTRKELEVFVTNWFKNIYWSRTEWEVLIGSLFQDSFTKIDVWKQIEINLDKLIDYIIKELDIKLGGM